MAKNLNKIDLISEIDRLYEENADLKRKLANVNDASGDMFSPTIGIATAALEFGKVKLFEELFDLYDLGVKYNNIEWENSYYKSIIINGNTKCLMTFEQWLQTFTFSDLKFNNRNSEIELIIKACSFNDIIKFFESELKNVYDKKCSARELELIERAKKESEENNG